jgi:hypothetical protein
LIMLLCCTSVDDGVVAVASAVVATNPNWV